MLITVNPAAPVTLPSPAIVGWHNGSPIVDVWTMARDKASARRWTIRVSRLTAPGDSNAKLAKNGKTEEYDTLGLSLAPQRAAGLGNTCPHASAGCAAACLDHQGMGGVWDSIPAARAARTALWYGARGWFLEQLQRELQAAQRSAERRGRKLAVRLNVFSDIGFEKFLQLSDFPAIEFYDYSKNPRRAGLLAPNYWVTFSRSESNEAHCRAALAGGANVAAAFATGRISRHVSGRAAAADFPRQYLGAPVIDGDTTDLRFADSRRAGGCVVGLRLKAGSWREYYGALDSGFAIYAPNAAGRAIAAQDAELRAARLGE